ncbi:hypothetical protein IG631_23178 [Alternaria alternata]|nr:hypothetical protein IG631_23178 [Alternaria alternata]
MLTSPSQACLPITRPVFRKFLSGSILGSKSHSTGPNPLSDFSGKGIKLRNSHRTKELDDNSSERQLAQHEDGSSGRGDMYYESYAERGGYNKTVVSRVDEVPDGNANAPGTYGIQVRNETNFVVDAVEDNSLSDGQEELGTYVFRLVHAIESAKSPLKQREC